ncbi:MAG: LamG domain-containing protein [Candidatus Poribacteria bacterium]
MFRRTLISGKTKSSVAFCAKPSGACIAFCILANLFILCLFISPSISQQENFLAGYWAFEEGSGNDVKDRSGNGNDGTISGKVKFVEGQVGKALEFSPGSCVMIPGSKTLDDVKELTVAMWIKFHSLPTNWSHLIERDGSYGITVNVDKTFRYTYNSGAVWLETDFTVKKGTWYYIAMSWDKSGGIFYVDGAKVHEDKGTVTIPTAPLEIAQCANYHVDGIIDEVKIWNKTLTEAEINLAMKGGAAVKPTGKLAAMWSQIKTEE